MQLGLVRDMLIGKYLHLRVVLDIKPNRYRSNRSVMFVLHKKHISLCTKGCH